MPTPFRGRHILLNGWKADRPYQYPNGPTPIAFEKQQRDRNQHGNRLLRKLNEIREQFNLNQETEIPEGLIWDPVIYVEFFTPWGFKLKTEQLNDNQGIPKFQLLKIEKEKRTLDEDPPIQESRYKALVVLKAGGVSHFIKKVTDYLDPQKNSTSRNTGLLTDTPSANDLVANIQEIQLATLEAFWSDGDFYPFPELDEEAWWEVWFRKSAFDESKISDQLRAIGAELGRSKLEFSENIVYLVKGTANQLSQSLFLLDCLSELRKPQEMNDFITGSGVSVDDHAEWMDNLKLRIQIEFNSESVIICLLDSGVNNRHGLLEDIIPDSQLYSWKANWGVSDTHPHGGHGTGMAGLSLFGDLTNTLASTDVYRIFHSIESFKILHPSAQTDKELCGVKYRDAVSISDIDRPTNPRVYCLSVTNNTAADFSGRPSSASASLDAIAFGPAKPRLLLASGGNVFYSQVALYPDQNFIESIQDPGQAYNVLTVGCFTQKDRLQNSSNRAIAPYGGMSPFNSTSGSWETKWPNKPDIVMEGGNLEVDGPNLAENDLLRLVSLHSNYPRDIFIPFDGTSAAVALAAKMAAELRAAYPGYWPETIRGLMVHSAKWTSAMEVNGDVNSESGRRALLRSVGYGVPDLQRAIQSANNSLTLIAQETISPFKKASSIIKYNEYHLYQLPWPKDILLSEIAEGNTRVTVTLSYFIEPNPGSREYANALSYHSHELDFKLIKPQEDLDTFTRRVSAASDAQETDEVNNPNLKGEEWAISRVRSKGSIRKDYLDTSGAELSTRNYLAIYPKSGWYKTRKALNKFDSRVRYSLIITIETESQEVDIYTPVAEMVRTRVEIRNTN